MNLFFYLYGDLLEVGSQGKESEMLGDTFILNVGVCWDREKCLGW